MRRGNSLNHARWECKYHIAFIPKYRRKRLFGAIRKELVEVFRRLARQKECEIEEGHLMPDHVHMMISIPPKYAVAQVVGYLKGKVRSTLHEFTPVGEGISQVSTSGPEATSHRHSAEMSRRSGITSGIRKPKIVDLTS